MTGQRSELSMACRLAAFTPKETTRFVPETRHSRAVLIQAFFKRRSVLAKATLCRAVLG